MNWIRRKLDQIFLLRLRPERDWPRWKRGMYEACRYGLLLCASVCVGVLALGFAYGSYSWDVFLSYFSSQQIVFLNILPASVLIFFLYGVFGRAWAAFLAGSGAVLGLSLGHYYKLLFRDDPLYFEDLLIIREAKAMASGGRYSLFIDRRIGMSLLFVVVGILLLAVLARGKLESRRLRVSTAVGAVLLAAALVPTYLDGKLYDSIHNFQYLNQWSATQNYISRGFLYPFLHSITDFVETPPKGYSESRARQLLSAYDGADIPADRRINIIAIMREAYVDFSRYGIEGLDGSGYDLYHALEEESLTGDLVTNIFAGGTVDTERCFLTGSYLLRNFRGPVNSYVWYLRQQGYTVEGSHPYYQWFYNRRNINAYLGFARYRFLEGDYERLSSAYYPPDSVLLPEIYADFQANKAAGKPYFSFSVNVQSHGPYDTVSPAQRQYLTGGNYSEACRNALDHYLTTVADTDVELMNLVEQLRTDPEPVVLVAFGDHLPWMGDGGAFYEELGVDLDLGTDEGFRRYYTTRYLIWANDAAREMLDGDISGEGPEISPCYLMPLLFRTLGWEGPAFLQAMDRMMDVFPVVTTSGRCVVDGQMVEEIPPERQALFQEFSYLQQYWRSRFLFGSLAE